MEGLKKSGQQLLYLAHFHSLQMVVLSSSTDSTTLMTAVLTFLWTFLPSPGKCVWKLFQFMVPCLTVQGFFWKIQRPIKYSEGSLFVLQICIRDCSLEIEMILKEYNSLEFSGTIFYYTSNRIWEMVSLPEKRFLVHS